MSTHNEAGFGEFQCLKCENKWKSTEAYENVAQKCNKCKKLVDPVKVRPLKKSKYLHTKTSEENLNGVGPFFGEFKCKKCRKEWSSAFTWFDDDKKTNIPQKCNRCKRNAFAFNMRRLIKGETDFTKPHLVHLCGKCKKLGYSCEVLKNERRGLYDSFSRLRI